MPPPRWHRPAAEGRAGRHRQPAAHGSRPPQRLDWILGTPDWNRALLRVAVINTKEVRRVTDHALVIAHFSLPAVQQMLSTAA